MALSLEKKVVKNSDILAVLALFHGLKYFFGFNLLALFDCFEDNSFYSLLNLYGGKYVKSALQAFLKIYLKNSRKVGLT